jgi:DNA-nicking Smr family endonuclease
MDWKPGSRKRALTADEAELWAYAMRDARSLQRRERRKTADAEATTGNGSSRAENSGPPQIPPAAKSPIRAVQHPPYTPPAPEPSRSPALAVYDEKERKRLGKNPELIEARLDLHGFRQREAHTALRSFLFSCSVRGLRHVLIITGKGTAAERQRDFFGEERGVLRRLVPQWLGEPELRNLVVSYTASHVRHGGEGALYVRLRKAGAR